MFHFCISITTQCTARYLCIIFVYPSDLSTLLGSVKTSFWVLLQRLQFSRSGVEPKIVHFQQAPK